MQRTNFPLGINKSVYSILCQIPPQGRDCWEDLLPAGQDQDPTHGATAHQEGDNRHRWVCETARVNWNHHRSDTWRGHANAPHHDSVLTSEFSPSTCRKLSLVKWIPIGTETSVGSIVHIWSLIVISVLCFRSQYYHRDGDGSKVWNHGWSSS